MNHVLKTFLVAALCGGIPVSVIIIILYFLGFSSLDPITVPLFFSGALGGIGVKYIFKK